MSPLYRLWLWIGRLFSWAPEPPEPMPECASAYCTGLADVRCVGGNCTRHCNLDCGGHCRLGAAEPFPEPCPLLPGEGFRVIPGGKDQP